MDSAAKCENFVACLTKSCHLTGILKWTPVCFRYVNTAVGVMNPDVCCLILELALTCYKVSRADSLPSIAQGSRGTVVMSLDGPSGLLLPGPLCMVCPKHCLQHDPPHSKADWLASQF